MNTENYCFCDLVPFYALDLLSGSEKAWVEEQAAIDPDLAEELATYQSAVTAIPYGSPRLEMSGDLKNRLFSSLELDIPTVETVPEQAPYPYSSVRSQDLNWQPHNVPRVLIAIVHTDQVKREIVGFLRAEPGVGYPFHRHAATEEIFMLEGDLVIGDEVFGAGDYIRSLPGSSHAPYTHGGCHFFFHTSMDDEYPELNTVPTETTNVNQF